MAEIIGRTGNEFQTEYFWQRGIGHCRWHIVFSDRTVIIVNNLQVQSQVAIFIVAGDQDVRRTFFKFLNQWS